MWRKSGYFGSFSATQFFDFGGKVAIFGEKVADFESKILATLVKAGFIRKSHEKKVKIQQGEKSGVEFTFVPRKIPSSLTKMDRQEAAQSSGIHLGTS